MNNVLEDSILLEDDAYETEINVADESIEVVASRSYNDLSNRPSINGVTLEGDKSTSDLGITSDIESIVSLAVEQEASERQQAIESLDAKIEDRATIAELEDEASLREEEDDRLSDEIDDLGEELNLEVNARTQADIALGNRIDLKADITALTAETTNRENADIELQSQIDAITSQSDVVDIVGTYAELQAYDTSHLGDNDIVKVLTDSTHDNAPSYFRWNKTEQTWSYVGSESVAYTKAEADDRFVPKTRTINNKALSENITLTTNDLTNDSGYLTEADLTDYVKNTDYATTTKGGVVKPSLATGSLVNTNGVIMPTNIEYEDYEDVAGNYFIGKGTLENVLEERKYLMPEFVQELPATGEDNKLYLTPAEEQPDVAKNVSGKEIEITDASEGDLIDWQLKGDTEQTSYTGKNLFNLAKVAPAMVSSFYPTTATSRITYTDSSILIPADISYSPNFGAGSAKQNENFYATLEKNTNYTFSFTGTNAVIIGYAYDQSTNRHVKLISDTDKTVSTFNSGNYDNLIVRFGKKTTSAPSEYSNIQLEKGSTATDFEPYVGGTSSPNPDYPQEVKTVTGRNAITLKSGNLFGLEGKTTSGIALTNNSGRVSITGTSASATSPSLANGEDLIKAGTYTLSLSKPAPLVLNLVATTASGNVSFRIAKGQTSATNTLTSDSTSQELFCGLEAKTYNEAFDIMFAKGSTPAPFQPYSKQEVEVNLGKNLFDKNNVVVGYVDTITGEINTSNQSARSTDFVKVEPNTNYVVSGRPGGFEVQGLYDSSKTFISRTIGSSITTPNNCHYIRFTCLNDDLATVMAERGSVATSYAPYFDHIGKNLFDFGTKDDYFVTNTAGSTIYSDNDKSFCSANITTNKLAFTSYTTTGYRWLSKRVALKNNTTYALSGSLNAYIRVIGFNSLAAGTVGTAVASVNANNQQTLPVTFNSGNYAYYAVSFYPNDNGQGFYENIMLEESSSATPYEQFIKPELCKLGDYQDRIYKVGNEWKIEKQTDKVDLSSLTWEYFASNILKRTGINPIANIKWATTNQEVVPSYSEMAIVRKGQGLSAPDLYGYYAIDANRIAFNVGTYGADPVGNLYYPLATPYTATITYQPLIDQLNELETLTTQKGYNAVSTDTPTVQPFLDFTYFRPDPTVTKDEWLWIENHYEQLGGERRYTHNMSVNHSTAQGHWDYAFTIVGKEANHYTQLAQVAYYLFREHAGLTIPVSGTYTEGNVVYLLTKITASSLSQVTIEMRKLSDGSVRTISTGSVPVLDTIS